MANSSKKRELKRKLFKRDGWQIEDGTWYADCEFGCGSILEFDTATLDRWPVMGKDGGAYVMSNLRLACKPCNSMNQNHKTIGKTRSDRMERRAARMYGQTRKERREHYRKVVLPEIQRKCREGRIRAQRNRSIEEGIIESKKEFVSFAPRSFPDHVKKMLAENYPRSEGLDKNCVPIELVYEYPDTP